MPRRAAGRGRGAGRWLLACALILPAPSSFAASAPAATPGAATSVPPSSFWESYLSARTLIRTSPEAARARSDSLLARDADDFLGRVMRAASWVRDSTRGDSVLKSSEGMPRKAGPQVEAGVIFLQRNQPDPAGSALARARRAYEEAGRLSDASRAALWRFRNAWDRGNAAPFMADVALAESLARRAGDPAALADVLILKGGQATRSDNRLARESFQEAYDLLAPLGPGRQLTGAHRGLALTLDRAGDHDGAAHHYVRALELAEAQRDTFQMFSSLGGLGFVQLAKEDFTGALATMQRAKTLAAAMRDPRALSKAYHDMGAVQLQMGEHLDARESNRAALRVMEEARLETDNKPVTMVNLASVETMLGEYDAAQAHLEEALVICRKRNIRLTTVDALIRLARLQRELGDLSESRRDSDEALELCRQASYWKKLAAVYEERARTLNALGLPQEALQAAREGKAAAREFEPRDVWHLVLDEAAALQALGRGGEAIAALDSMLAGPVADSSHLERVLVLKGDLLLQAGQVRPAIAVLQQGLEIARAVDTPGRVADAQLTLGRALLESGEPGRAAAMLEEGLAWFESVQSAVQASQERSAYQAQWHDSYVTLARAYATSGQRTRSFATLERSRAREVRRVFARRAPASARVPADLTRRMDDVALRLTGLQASLFSQYAEPASERSKSLPILERRVDSLRAEWAKLDRRLQREAPAYARETGLLPAATSREVQRALRSGERLLAYMVGRDKTLLFDMTSGTLDIHPIAIGEAALAREVEQVTGALRRGAAEGSAADRSAAPALAQRLLGACRLAEHPPRTLYIAPDAALHHLPFEALPLAVAGGASARHLVERSEVVYVASATLWLHPPGQDERRTPKQTPLVAFGDPEVTTKPAGGEPSATRGGPDRIGPLPHARREVRELSARFEGARLYVGDQATEGRFYTEAPLAPRVHLAAHAFVDEIRPEFSGIVLARGAAQAPGSHEDDGLVQAFEIMTRRLDLDLVVVSACESGGGRLVRGEGLLGLSRSFRLAGARNLVVSLWKVDDAATADLMSEFYARLASGTNAATALREAKLALMRRAQGREPLAVSEDRGVGVLTSDERSSSPSAWAAFVLLGTRR